MENKILFDWLSFTCKTKRVDINGVLIEKINERNLVELLGLENLQFEELPGVKGFKNRMYFDGISIHYNSEIYDYMYCPFVHVYSNSCACSIQFYGCR